MRLNRSIFANVIQVALPAPAARLTVDEMLLHKKKQPSSNIEDLPTQSQMRDNSRKLFSEDIMDRHIRFE